MTGTDAIRATADEIIKIISARNIVGDPIEIEDKIIIPITKMGMGFGTGQGREPEGNETVATKSEAGGGAGIIPVAILVVLKGVPGKNGVRVIPISSSSDKEPYSGIAKAAQVFLEKIAVNPSQGRREKRPPRESAVAIE